MSTPEAIRQFQLECDLNIAAQGGDKSLQAASLQWNIDTARYKYTYNFSVLGRPIIQFPQDMVALQEVIWAVRPDLIVETGIAHGGSLMLSASMLALLDYCDAVEAGTALDPRATRRRVIGIDIDIRAHNRAAIEAHPMAHRIDLIEGSSTDLAIVAQVRAAARGKASVLVILDSNHTHEHVLAELEAYAPLTTPGSYCIVMDTVVDDLPANSFPDRPWGKDNNPKTAVREYLRLLREEGRSALDGMPLALEINQTIDHKLLISVAPDGYLRRLKG